MFQVDSISYIYPSIHIEDMGKNHKTEGLVNVDYIVLKHTTGEKMWIMLKDKVTMSDEVSEVPFTTLKSLELKVSDETPVSTIVFEAYENDEDHNNSMSENIKQIKKGVYGKLYTFNAKSADLGFLNDEDKKNLVKQIASEF